MDFKEKTPEQIKSLTDVEFEAYQNELYASKQKNSEALENTIKELKTQGESFAAENEELRKSNAEMLDIAKKQGVAISNLLKNNQAEPNKQTLCTELKSKMAEIKSIAKRESSKEVDIVKANTVRNSVVNNTESFRLLDIAQLAHTKLSMYDVFPKIPVSTSNNNGVISYTDWDEATTVRAATMIAETGSFPESTARFIEKTINIRKVGDTLPVSEEFYEDDARFAAELELFLQTNIQLKVDDQLANGTGVGEELKGLIVSATPFNGTGLSTVPFGTFYDLLAITPEMNVGFGSKYAFDVVFMNKKQINRLRLEKDANNNYIIPPFVSQSGTEVDGMVVLESNVIPDNQCVLGDRRYGKIYEKPGVTMARAAVGTQFVEDLETIKVRKRLAFLVRESEKRAFIHIADITAAILSITTAP